MPIAPGSTATDDTRLADLATRFAAALERLEVPHVRNGATGRIGLAVSGGRDSMAMLLLAQATVAGRFEVAAVDHRLRPEARVECALVERVCRARGIPCTILTVELADGNLQHQARKARYRALAEWAKAGGLAAIATAHHADDQAETLLMRMNRGSGLAGLAGVRGSLYREDLAIRLIRPVLDFRRAELAQVVAAAGIAAVQDPSNQDPRFDRVRIRRALAEADWLDPAALARCAAHLAQAEEALAAFAERMWDERVAHAGTQLRIRPDGIPHAIALRLLERAIATLGSPPRGSEVARLLHQLEAGVGGNLAGVLVTTAQGVWLLAPEPPRRTRSPPAD